MHRLGDISDLRVFRKHSNFTGRLSVFILLTNNANNGVNVNRKLYTSKKLEYNSHTPLDVTKVAFPDAIAIENSGCLIGERVSFHFKFDAIQGDIEHYAILSMLGEICCGILNIESYACNQERQQRLYIYQMIFRSICSEFAQAPCCSTRFLRRRTTTL